MGQFPFKSLRQWIDHLSATNQLVSNSQEVDLRGEIGAISRRICLTEGPAVLHSRVQGYPGWRIFSDGLTTRHRQAMALGLVSDYPLAEITQRIATAQPVAKTRVEDENSAPCKEVKLKGNEVNLLDIPFPFTTEYEGPPYITAGISIVKDPDTGWQNAGIRRFQLKGPRKLSSLVLPMQHEGLIFSKYLAKRQPMPISIVIGADPLSYICTLFPAPPQVNELDYWSVIAGEPLAVVKSETSDLLIPATAEMVIEGYVDPEERIFEGPFSEFTGYYSGTRYLPVIHVEAITMRRDPIVQYMYMGKPPSEGHRLMDLGYEIELYRQIKPFAPEVVDVAVLSTHFFTGVVSIEREAHKKTPGLVKKVAMLIKGTKAGHTIKNLFVVEDDVNIRDINDVLWAFSVRFQAAKDITVIPLTQGLFLDPSEPWLGVGQGYSSLAIFDCTEKPFPYDEGYKRGVAVPSRAVQELVARRWQEYGFS